MIKVLSVFGTRPEAIKMAPVIRELATRPEEFQSTVCVTAQHRDMLDQVMRCFDLSADYDLDLMTDDQTPADVVMRVLESLPAVLDSVKPDFLLVQGDTMTTFAAAFAAFLNRIPVGHIEAGLRTGNLANPFPEEMNRRLTTQLSVVHFAPTDGARNALLAEGIDDRNIVVTGNTVIDALLQTVNPEYEFLNSTLNALDSSRRLVLITTHRRENFGTPLSRICDAVGRLSESLSDTDFVLPVHRNPQVRRTVETMLGNHSNVYLLEPMEYEEFAHLMARSTLILSDSGGIQEEAPSLNVPVLVLRQFTERPEGVSAGATRLVGTTTEKIIANTMELLQDPTAYQRMADAQNPYGVGKASTLIVSAISDFIRNINHESRLHA